MTLIIVLRRKLASGAHARLFRAVMGSTYLSRNHAHLIEMLRLMNGEIFLRVAGLGNKKCVCVCVRLQAPDLNAQIFLRYAREWDTISALESERECLGDFNETCAHQIY